MKEQQDNRVVCEACRQQPATRVLYTQPEQPSRNRTLCTSCYELSSKPAEFFDVTIRFRISAHDYNYQMAHRGQSQLNYAKETVNALMDRAADMPGSWVANVEPYQLDKQKGAARIAAGGANSITEHLPKLPPINKELFAQSIAVLKVEMAFHHDQFVKCDADDPDTAEYHMHCLEDAARAVKALDSLRELTRV